MSIWEEIYDLGTCDQSETCEVCGELVVQRLITHHKPTVIWPYSQSIAGRCAKHYVFEWQLLGDNSRQVLK